MNSVNRLPSANQSLGRPVRFRFDGKEYVGKEGDTLASALLANGVGIVGRSFKLHRPRGLMGSGLEEPNGLVRLETGRFAEPNVRATLVPLYEGLQAFSQNAWPSVQFDCLGALDYAHKLFPASFYYKSMMWPNWGFYEKFVRPIAGLGKAPEGNDAQRYQKRNIHCDILICGGGPAGLSAALEAGRSGAKVVLVDDQESFGGALKSETYLIDGESANAWATRAVNHLSLLPNVTLLPRTTVSGYYENNFVSAVERVTQHLGPKAPLNQPRERLWRIRAEQVILATGSIERPLVFPNNDRPGIMLASAVRSYANRFGIVPGQQVVVATNNDNAYRTVFDLHDLGIKGITVVDARLKISGSISSALSNRNIKLYQGYAVSDATGSKKLSSIQIARHAGEGLLDNEQLTVACDLLAISSGWTPTIHLFSQAGGKLRYDQPSAALVPESCSQNLAVVGSANGTWALADCIAEGQKTALATLKQLKIEPASTNAVGVVSGEDMGFSIEPYWYTKNRRTDKQWLDFQYDVKVADIELAVRENFVSVEHVKRYTTGGMSVDQGKTSNFNILAILAELCGKPLPNVGTTRFRPPYQPVTMGTFAGPTLGKAYSAWQELPAHAWHVKRGAHFADYGWKRPEYYPRGSENKLEATLREVNTVRKSVGVFDGSPLGKIEVFGPDAGVFLNRMYVNNIESLKVGFARYALMTNENGILIDDGVIVRLEQDRFLVHATSGAAPRVFLAMEECLQNHWPDLQVFVNNVTTQWGNVTVSGPQARAVVQQLESDIDFGAEAFPHMHFRAGTIQGIPVRVLRASFTGEATYEISIPVRYVESLFEAVFEAGQPFGITPYGIEALEMMRTEKGYLHIGGDTDGSTNPIDVGFAKIIEKKQGDFIGRRSLQREADNESSRFQFVGLEAVDPSQLLPVGGHVVDSLTPSIPAKSRGYVTAACLSPTLGRSVGLGIVTNGASRIGEEIYVFARGKTHAARIVSPSHYDPKGEKLNA
ncbi:sarcosine oxidase subunit alpha family protein [Pseudomonas monteilii]|uniref:sarcosine oxidase subunit alpha family protein n=1 Tax=Pseudomonas monteilii TaxID=76759 RepID=UPI00380467DB